jgi:uncharacterized protein (DUF697 family)
MASYKETLDRILQGDFDSASPEERAAAVRDVINVCSVGAGAVTFQPIPFLDIALVSPIQIAMVQAIGRIYGHRLDQKAIIEMLSTFGASLLAQNAIIAAAKFIPFAGWVVAISMAYALTYAIGEVADHYFKNGRGVSAEELKSMFDRVYHEKKKEKQEAHEGNSDLKDRLEKLKRARADGILTEEEFERKKQELLQGF